MVGKWTPDPPREPCNDNLSMVGAEAVIMQQESSDSEEETLPHNGYELLPQQILSDGHDSGSEDIDNAPNGNIEEPEPLSSCSHNIASEGNEFVQQSQNSFETERLMGLREVWSAPVNSSSIEMGMEQAEQVRAAMANFVLPPSAIPAWASALPEDQWKQQLLDRIQTLQQKSHEMINLKHDLREAQEEVMDQSVI